MSDPLPPGEMRRLLREHLTIVKPGEILVVRVPWTTTPARVRDYQRAMDSAEGGVIPFKVLVVAGDELGVVEPGEPGFLKDCYIEQFRAGLTGPHPVRITHQPTGVRVDGTDRDEAVRLMAEALAAR